MDFKNTLQQAATPTVPIPPFPLRSSLFWPDGNKIGSTWDYLARTLDPETRERMIKWQAAQGMNTLIFLTYNRDPNGPVNPFLTLDGPALDPAEVARWMQLLEPGRHGAVLIPCLFCDEDPATARNIAFQDHYVPLACVGLTPFSKAICIGLEANEEFPPESQERLIALAKRHTHLPITTHMQWRYNSSNPRDRLPSGLDALIYEHPWHPAEGDRHSADEVASIGAEVIRRSGLPVFFNEYNLNVNGPRIRQQTRALAALPGCVGIGGPFQD